MNQQTSYQKAIEAGFNTLRSCAANPDMQHAVRMAMIGLYQADLLMSLRLGDPPANPMLDPRWWTES